MEKERLQDNMEIWFDIEEEQLYKEMDKKKLTKLRNDALLEFRKNSKKEQVKHIQIKFTSIKVAASITLLAALSIIIYLFSQKSTTDYSDLAFDRKENLINTETSLILADGSKIEINSDKSMLTYDKLGEKIEIDSNKTINLEKKRIESGNKLAFNKLIVPYGKQSRINLSDGSTVWLNAGSYLMYPQKFDNEKREVYLSGEAYFDITKNETKPFVVKTSEIQIDVLGTAFNVTAYADDPNIETILVRGSVEINKPGSKFSKKRSYVLKPGQLASYSKKSKIVNTQNVDIENYVSWREGYFLCKKIPLSKLVMKLSRFYNVEIKFDDESITKTTFSGKLENKENISKVLDVINETTTIEYKELDNMIIISSLKGN